MDHQSRIYLNVRLSFFFFPKFNFQFLQNPLSSIFRILGARYYYNFMDFRKFQQYRLISRIFIVTWTRCTRRFIRPRVVDRIKRDCARCSLSLNVSKFEIRIQSHDNNRRVVEDEMSFSLSLPLTRTIILRLCASTRYFVFLFFESRLSEKKKKNRRRIR